MRVLKLVCCAAALTALLAPGARADEWNKKTFFTFSGPVQVPGVTLPAGTYTFKLADLSGNRHVVQIFDKDEKKIYTTILAIPDQRLEPTDKPLVLFAERSAGLPQAVKAWFYPGNTIGDEFVYPRTQAIAIAKATHESVLASNEESAQGMRTANVERVNENTEMQTTTTPPQTTTAPRAAVGPEATPAPSGSRENRAVGTSGRTAVRRLPTTASDFPLLALLSGLSIAAGFGVRRARRRLAEAD